MYRRAHTYYREAKPRKKRKVSAARLRDLPNVIHGLAELSVYLGLDYATVHRWTTLPRPVPTVERIVEKNKHYTIRRDDLILWLFHSNRLTDSAKEIAIELVQALGSKSLPEPIAEPEGERVKLPRPLKRLPAP